MPTGALVTALVELLPRGRPVSCVIEPRGLLGRCTIPTTDTQSDVAETQVTHVPQDGGVKRAQGILGQYV